MDGWVLFSLVTLVSLIATACGIYGLYLLERG